MCGWNVCAHLLIDLIQLFWGYWREPPTPKNIMPHPRKKMWSTTASKPPTTKGLEFNTTWKSISYIHPGENHRVYTHAHAAHSNENSWSQFYFSLRGWGLIYQTSTLLEAVACGAGKSPGSNGNGCGPWPLHNESFRFQRLFGRLLSRNVSQAWIWKFVHTSVCYIHFYATWIGRRHDGLVYSVFRTIHLLGLILEQSIQ